MRLVRRPAVTLAAACLALSALSACGGGEDDGEEPTSTTVSPLPGDSTTSSSTSSSGSTSTSSSSTSKGGDAAPELPAAAKEDSPEGATAFAKHYWLETGRAVQFSDASALKKMSTECVPCDEYVATVVADAKKKQHADQNPIKITSAKVTDETDGKSESAVKLTVTETSYKMVDDSGEPVEQVDGVSYDVIVYLDRAGSSWTVTDLFALT